jgi:hypothetical protein
MERILIILFDKVGECKNVQARGLMYVFRNARNDTCWMRRWRSIGIACRDDIDMGRATYEY